MAIEINKQLEDNVLLGIARQTTGNGSGINADKLGNRSNNEYLLDSDDIKGTLASPDNYYLKDASIYIRSPGDITKPRTLIFYTDTLKFDKIYAGKLLLMDWEIATDQNFNNKIDSAYKIPVKTNSIYTDTDYCEYHSNIIANTGTTIYVRYRIYSDIHKSKWINTNNTGSRFSYTITANDNLVQLDPPVVTKLWQDSSLGFIGVISVGDYTVTPSGTSLPGNMKIRVVLTTEEGIHLNTQTFDYADRDRLVLKIPHYGFGSVDKVLITVYYYTDDAGNIQVVSPYTTVVATKRKYYTFRDSIVDIDVTRGTWVATAKMMEKGNKYSVVVYDNRYVMFNGGEGSMGAGIDTCYRYDTETRAVLRLNDLPYNTYYHALVVRGNGDLLLIGGRDQGNYYKYVYIYNKTNDQWSLSNIDNIPVASSVHIKHAYSKVTNKLYLLYLDQSAINTVMYSLSDGSTTWVQEVAPVFNIGGNPENWLYGLDMITMPDGNILISGGYANTSGTYTNMSQIYNVTTQTWSAGPTLNSGRAYHSMVMHHTGDILVFGGYNGATDRLNVELISNGNSNFTDTYISNWPVSPQTMVSNTVLVNNDLVRIGGYSYYPDMNGNIRIYNSTDITTYYL